jgi:phosphate transport system permease protein
MDKAATIQSKTAAPAALEQSQLFKKVFRHLRERLIESLLFLAALSAVATTVAIVLILLYESLTFFEVVSVADFVTDTQWTPLFSDAHFGVLPLLSGTFRAASVALAVAIPLGTIAAVYLSEFAPMRVREIIKPMFELLLGVPTVVYGYFALLFVTPLLQKTLLPDLPGFNLLSAGIVIGIMLLPYVSSLSEDAMRAVPMAIREAAYAMGATRFQTAMRIVLPAAFSGVAAAYTLAFARAVGETMIVAIAGGQMANLSWDPVNEGATLTGYIAQVALGDLPYGSTEYKTIFACGLVLILLTLIFNTLGHFLRKRYRERY